MGRLQFLSHDRSSDCHLSDSLVVSHHKSCKISLVVVGRCPPSFYLSLFYFIEYYLLDIFFVTVAISLVHYLLHSAMR